MRVSVAFKYLKQVEFAILDAAFQSWQSLGNSDPLDDSGASAEVSACISAPCPFNLREASLALSSEDYSSGLAREMSGYCDLLTGLSRPRPKVPPSAIEKLLPCCTPENVRAQRILSATGCILGAGPGEVPGLDRSSAFLAAAEFFVEASAPRPASLILSRGKWDLPRSYRTAAMSLLLTPHHRPARVAWEMAASMGDETSSSHCAAYDYLEGKGSPSRFRAIHRTAERGFILPLLVAASALELGVGVDRDQALASAYMSVAKKMRPPTHLVSLVRGKMNGGKVLRCEHHPAQKNASAIMFNWSSKHASDPIHLHAAKEWRRARLAAQPPHPTSADQKT